MKSRKSESFKRRTSMLHRKSTDPDRYPPEHTKTNQLPPIDVFHTPLSSPLVSESENDQEVVNSSEKQEEAKTEAKIYTNSVSEVPKQAYTELTANHEITVIEIKDGDCSSISSADDDDENSITTPGRTPRRVTDRRSFQDPLDTTGFNLGSPICPSPSLLSYHRRYVSSFGASSSTIHTRELVSSPTVLNRSVSNRTQFMSNAGESANAEAICPIGEDPGPGLQTDLVILHSHEVSLDRPTGERVWPAWLLPEPSPPISHGAPKELSEDSLAVGKYHRPVVIAASFYNWFMNLVFRRVRKAGKGADDYDNLPDNVRDSTLHVHNRQQWEREMALSQTLLMQRVVRAFMSNQGFPLRPTERRLWYSVRREGRDVVKTINGSIIQPSKALLSSPQLWKPLMEFIAGQIFEALIISQAFPTSHSN